MNHDAIIQEAVKRVQAEKPTLRPNDPAMHPSDPVVGEFVRYDGDHAVVRSVDGCEERYPRDEVVNPNRVRDIAMQLKFGIGEN